MVKCLPRMGKALISNPKNNSGHLLKKKQIIFRVTNIKSREK
jgi:hypothetical protein